MSSLEWVEADSALSYAGTFVPQLEEETSVWLERRFFELLSVAYSLQTKLAASNERNAFLEKELELERAAEPTIILPMKVKRIVPGRTRARAKAGFYLFGADQDEVG